MPTLPPMVLWRNEAGSGGYISPYSAMARCKSPVITPGCTRAHMLTLSISRMRFMRTMLSTMPPASGIEPPARPEPAPRETMGTRYCDATRMIAATCSVLRGRITQSGGSSRKVPS